MDAEDIRAAVEQIKMLNDDQVQHGLEDELHEKFIEFIAEHGPPELQAMAKEVLKTKEISFNRRCG